MRHHSLVARWGAVVALVVVTSTLELAGSTPADGYQFPECTASQVSVKCGTTENRPWNLPARWGISLTPVTFTNRGSTCHLAFGGPLLRLEFGAPGPAPTVRPSQLSNPVGPLPFSLAPRLTHGANQVVYLVVTSLANPLAKQCHRTTAHAILVQGYAKGTGVGRYARRRIPNVCAVQAHSPSNVGAYWSQRFAL